LIVFIVAIYSLLLPQTLVIQAYRSSVSLLLIQPSCSFQPGSGPGPIRYSIGDMKFSLQTFLLIKG